MNETKTTSIQEIKANLFRKLNIKNNRYDKNNTYRNKCIKFTFKRMSQLKERKQILFNDILFQKMIFNETKL